MSSLSNQVMRSCIKDHEASAMEVGRRQKSEVEEEEEEDPFLQFIEYAKSVLSPDEAKGPSWSWIAYKILKTCIAYSSGVTSAILLSDLFQVQYAHSH